MTAPVRLDITVGLRLALVAAALCVSLDAFASPPGWTADQALWLGAFNANEPVLASSPDGRLMILWEDERDLDQEVYYKVRPAGGVWSSDSVLTGG